ncbi:MAG: hypothetical protein KJ906_01300 [Nanoarchaeota archaeon]|nr:hypothetical protein [Nanoarchaeota archaeon]
MPKRKRTERDAIEILVEEGRYRPSYQNDIMLEVEINKIRNKYSKD